MKLGRFYAGEIHTAVSIARAALGVGQAVVKPLADSCTTCQSVLGVRATLKTPASSNLARQSTMQLVVDYQIQVCN
jgi:hypothetical protein